MIYISDKHCDSCYEFMKRQNKILLLGLYYLQTHLPGVITDVDGDKARQAMLDDLNIKWREVQHIINLIKEDV